MRTHTQSLYDIPKAMHFSVSQIASHCTILRHNARYRNETPHNTTQHNTKQHNTTQHNATQRNTMQHTGTHLLALARSFKRPPGDTRK